MKKTLLVLIFLFLAPLTSVEADNSLFESPIAEVVPTLFKGRFRPADAYARLWLHDIHNRSTPLEGDSSALELLWKMHYLGHTPWDSIPLISLRNKEVKSLLELDPSIDHYSYNTLKKAVFENPSSRFPVARRLIRYHYHKAYNDPKNRFASEKIELKEMSPGLWVTQKEGSLTIASAPETGIWKFLEKGMLIFKNNKGNQSYSYRKDKLVIDAILSTVDALQLYEQISGPFNAADNAFNQNLKELQATGVHPSQIHEILSSKHRLHDRLAQSGNLLRVLPGKNPGEWFSLHSLNIQTYNTEKNSLVPIGNFTPYPDEQFEKIRSLHDSLQIEVNELHSLKLESDLDKVSKIQNISQDLYLTLHNNYSESLAGNTYLETASKTLSYPTLSQLRIESLYYQLPIGGAAITAYLSTLFLFFLAYSLKKDSYCQYAMVSMVLAFSIHSILLALRCYVLQRPPVSDMFETVLYVPWVAVCVSFFLYYFMKSRLLLVSSSLAAVILLAFLSLNNLTNGLENVQAVLDSQYWLTIHVLMIVGSYGIFVLCGILGHIYLAWYALRKKHTEEMNFITKLILQTMYLGTALLIPGTILGGVWAAESWGRFWDWDPKESWAFISSCTYIIFIHTYTFRHIKHFGLALGAIVGLLSISFTWYGVNYILGSGLHSYGFGNGGEMFYGLFLATELAFIGYALLIKSNESRLKIKN
ncbi:MAG: ABC-type transport system involved in cytochrome c biogenesis permease subunit [Chlamydiales bacterium]|jgi:ABC-type transport system involved in cytochrome c biogenesis permease subunit